MLPEPARSTAFGHPGAGDRCAYDLIAAVYGPIGRWQITQPDPRDGA